MHNNVVHFAIIFNKLWSKRAKKAHTKLSSQCFSSLHLIFCFAHHFFALSHSVLFSFVFAHAHKFSIGISSFCAGQAAHCKLIGDCCCLIAMFVERSECIPITCISTSVYITIDAHHSLWLLAKVLFLFHCSGGLIKNSCCVQWC